MLYADSKKRLIQLFLREANEPVKIMLALFYPANARERESGALKNGGLM